MAPQRLDIFFKNFLFQGKGKIAKSADIYAVGACIPRMLCLADMSLDSPNKDSAAERNNRLVIDFFY